MKKIEYMAQFVGEEFSGVISGVTAFGIFVELDNGVEGLVHVSTMVNDYYEYVEEQFAMVGERTQAKYRLGDEVEVLLVRASVEERNLDFVLKDNGAYDPEAMKNAVRGGRSGGKGKSGKAGKGEKKGGKDKKEKGRGERKPKKAAMSPDEIVVEQLYAVDGEEKPKKKRSRGGRGKKRGASGEKLPKQEQAQPQKGSRKRADKEAKPQEKGGSDRSRNREERRGGKEGDYHRVYVTGLNSAVWPDPPGYHERKLREEARQEKEKAKKAPKRRPRPHRKTEGGTANSK